MRIIIEIDEEADTETTKAEVRKGAEKIHEGTRGREKTHQEATDAGEAPSSSPALAEETATSGPQPRRTRERPEQGTNGGAAPQSLPTPPSKNGMDVSPTGRATDAGAAPGPKPEPGRSPVINGGMPSTSGSPKKVSQAKSEKTDAGPPSVPPSGSSATVEETQMDYETMVSGTVEEVKDRVKGEHLDIMKLIEAERAGDDRNTLIEWLEKQKA
ncbi:hypothetical protein HFX_6074 (plasmid) [Haloferax mediterranei ATCC 33500]|uniref:Uncharacterized protein n=2 Tax=Haloferax mediterranei (strain ATCC 33500 / DSM 1411 / JCM 8866 / NBRC 14739 / NCIMB 2177 / R-4) TaxID=523841 RepID=I3RAE1_HALMT|nr:hypothetical protein HFX_6074 [Haloferax mediterranei ATCC 33500]